MLINLEARVDNGSDPGAVREKVAGSLEQKVVRGRAGRDAKVTGMTERVQESRTRLREKARLFHPPGFVIRPPEASRGWPSGSWEGPALCPQAVRKQKAHTLQLYPVSPFCPEF